VRGAWRGEPLSFGFFHSPQLRAAITQSLRETQYDAVFVYCSSMIPYLPDNLQVPIVIDFVDADSQKWAQYSVYSRPPAAWIYGREARLLSKQERKMGQRAALSLATTARDARELRGSEPFRVEVIPQGAEVPEAVAPPPPLIHRLAPYVVFVGTMDYRPNVDAVRYFAHEILPLVRCRYSDLNFIIVGRNPSKTVRSLARRPGIVVTGAVHDVYGYLRSALAAVAPFRISQGFHSKILEAAAVGTPVVATRRAGEAVGLSPDEGLFFADTPREFADLISRIIEDADLRRRIRAGAASVQLKVSWPIALGKLESLLTDAIAGQKQSSTMSLRVAGYE
jgi:sugar transferase (PEP-CTERM/EpsH1 system associated)